MISRKNRCCRGSRRGTAVIEVALILPLLLFVLFGIIEFGSVFYVRHNMVTAARQAARVVAVQDGTAGQAQAAALLQLGRFPSMNFTVVVTEPSGGDPDDHDVNVTITVPLAEAALADPLGIMEGRTVTADVTMRQEG